jgi:alginate O-acetyltransferase complex protein AlgI
MTLSSIILFIIVALVYNVFVPVRWRGWALFVISLIALYWLQPALNIRWLDALFPTLTLMLGVLGWWLTRADGQTLSRSDCFALGLIGLLIIWIGISRYVDLPLALTTRPPPIEYFLLLALMCGGLMFGSRWIGARRSLTVMLWLLIGLFVVLKTEPLATSVSGWLRGWVGQDVTLASPLDLGWLGFSYLAFRLIHTVRDRQIGRLPEMDLRQYMTFMIFFPALTAGPIDRAERFIKQQDNLTPPPLSKRRGGLSSLLPNRYASPPLQSGEGDLGGEVFTHLADGLTRITIGIFKKFVIADTLAIVSLSAITAEQATSTGALWVMVYAYALRLFFDFSGYTDIAIGIGLLFGVRLPENFKQPYLKNNLATFWQSWHITLSDWVRFYVYMPLSRYLLKRKWKQNTVVAIVTFATMVIIGLWHGVTIPFFIWGLWHGAGLFIHKLWSDKTRKAYRQLQSHPKRALLWQGVGIFITFHFVVLGWIWFALTDFGQALGVFFRLFGIEG